MRTTTMQRERPKEKGNEVERTGEKEKGKWELESAVLSKTAETANARAPGEISGWNVSDFFFVSAKA